MKASTRLMVMATHSWLAASEIDEICPHTRVFSRAAGSASEQALDCPTLK